MYDKPKGIKIQEERKCAAECHRQWLSQNNHLKDYQAKLTPVLTRPLLTGGQENRLSSSISNFCTYHHLGPLKKISFLSIRSWCRRLRHMTLLKWSLQESKWVLPQVTSCTSTGNSSAFSALSVRPAQRGCAEELTPHREQPLGSSAAAAGLCPQAPHGDPALRT